MEVTINHDRVDEAMKGSLRKAKDVIREILGTGQYYYTDEIARELSTIDNGLNNLKLDSAILKTSPDWQRKIGTNEIGMAKQNAVVVMDKVLGCLSEYKHSMSQTGIMKKQENEYRELHHWAMSSLKEIQRDLAPYSSSAHQRLQQFGDHVGVSDRFTGYRHNLTRNRPPVQMRSSWMEKSVPKQTRFVATSYQRPSSNYETNQSRIVSAPPGLISGMVEPVAWTGNLSRTRLGSVFPLKQETRGYQTIDSLYPKSSVPTITASSAPYSRTLECIKSLNTLNSMTAADRAVETPRRLQQRSIQEQCGINTTVPGNTEYMSRYYRPAIDPFAGNFTVNPTPDFGMLGRPMMRDAHYRGSTEYQTRYNWPDASMLKKLPWLRV